MATDRARRTFDATREYRAVVWQQGRVTVEADGNEAEEIRAEESRRNLVDVIGSAGTPDDGYRVTVPAPSGLPFDFAVGPGTMYLGGVRVHLEQASGWLAQAARDWVDMPRETITAATNEMVLLWLQEAEVSAVEDAALRETALGGPDTAGRLRLLQHILRIPVTGGDCAAGLADAVATWQQAGLSFDPATRRLLSSARLQVSFRPQADPTNLCEPAAQAGYLGAENQLVRVQLAVNPTTQAVDRLLWGYDNASFLYRVQPEGGSTRLKLDSIPVDVHHRPQAGQAVEVLRATAQLQMDGGGEYVAAPHGFVTTLAAAWDEDTGTVELATALPSEYLDTTITPRLFLRVWNQLLPIEAGPIQLGDTGLRVTLSGAPFVAGDHWMIGGRPGVPQTVSPARLLAAPQPPDGPQRWTTPLAALHWTSPNAAEISDCRSLFDDLVDLTKRRAAGCCTLNLTSDDLRTNTLQEIIDRQIVGRNGIVVCLAPGRYELTAPLRLDARHSGLTLEGCGGVVVIAAAAKALDGFADGLVVLNRPDGVTLRGLQFNVPLVPFDFGQLQMGRETRNKLETAVGVRLFTAVGVQARATNGLRISDCEVTFTRPRQGMAIASGVRLVGGAQATQIESTRFVAPGSSSRLRDLRDRDGDLADFYVGIYGASSVSFEPNTLPGPTGTMRAHAVAGPINDLTVRGCRIEGSVAALWLGGLLGDLQIEDNVVRGASSGFILMNGAARVTGATLANSDLPELPDTGVIQDWKTFVAAQGSLRRDKSLVLGEILQRMATPLAEIGVEPIALSFRPGTVDKEERAAWEPVKRPGTEATRPEAPGRPGLPGGNAVPADIFDDLADALARVDRVLDKLQRSQGLRLRLLAAGNDIDTTLRDAAGAFWLSSEVTLDTGELVFNGNRLRVKAVAVPALYLYPVRRCCVTGNVIVNEAPVGQPMPLSAFIQEGLTDADRSSSVAVTGNVFIGAVKLPERINLPPPLNTWLLFNSFALP